MAYSTLRDAEFVVLSEEVEGANMKYHKRINISNDLMAMANVVAEAIVNHPDTAATLEAGEQTELYIIYKDNPSPFNAINFADNISLFKEK